MAWSGTATATMPTWSASRDQQLQTCERRYFFQYLARGRINSDDPFQKRVGLFKKLKPLIAWQGECVHAVVADYIGGLREGRRLSDEQILVRLRERIRRDWMFSSGFKYRAQPWQIDKLGVALLEHEYGEMPADVSAETVFAKTSGMMERFLAWANGPGALAAKVASADRIWIEPPGFGPEAPGFIEEDTQVLTKVDLALEWVGKEFLIYDWKTGAARNGNDHLSQNELQVAIYQLWPHRTLDIPLEQVASHLVYLGGAQAEERRFVVDGENLATVLLAIQDSIRLARRWDKYVADGTMTLADCGYASSPEVCRQCVFKRLCRESLQKSL